MKFFVEVYGCQMNTNDTEILNSILQKSGFERTLELDSADAIFLMTCAIRENAESKIWHRLRALKSLKTKRSSGSRPPKIGVLGCMAERLKEKLLEHDKLVDIVAGPDSYRSIPYLLSLSENTHQGVANVMLSADETYADIMPLRLNEDSVTAHLSIMRGCQNMCSFCIVPFTRGIERSRQISSILDEVRYLSDQGVKEVTLLGQNVNSYRDTSTDSLPSPFPLNSSSSTSLSPGFTTIYKQKEGGRRFAELLYQVAKVDPEMRIRFTSPHPKDFPDELLFVINEFDNICKQIHIPAQSGSTEVLKRMRRGYTREAYLSLVDRMKSIIPGVSLSTDIIAGFCGETEQEHEDTVSLMKAVKYDMAFMFHYSMRPKTHAHRNYTDDVPLPVKLRRLNEIIETFHSIARPKNAKLVGSTQLVLTERPSKRDEKMWSGKLDGGIRVNFGVGDVPGIEGKVVPGSEQLKRGDYVAVRVTGSSSTSLTGVVLEKVGLKEYFQKYGNNSRKLGLEMASSEAPPLTLDRANVEF
ncbi:hypothetical protein BKA69DRAFT_1028046 [Paraphysoderma sedebokerense]|nr:hypothetical protein BKA69DRAFT_1028046 [Paraphysoderma sedebokerense]